jgi:hypothetical protein
MQLAILKLKIQGSKLQNNTNQARAVIFNVPRYGVHRQSMLTRIFDRCI